MSEFRQYRRTQISELRPYLEGEALSDRVSITAVDREAGSPKPGDMIARNPANPDDQWLIARAYFDANYEPAQARASCPECARLIAELCRVNFDLGIAQGQLTALSWPFAISPHEAWEQGRAAGKGDRNPFPKPEDIDTPRSSKPQE